MHRSRSSASFSGAASGASAATPLAADDDSSAGMHDVGAEAASAKGTNWSKRLRGYLLRVALQLQASSPVAVLSMLGGIALALLLLLVLYRTWWRAGNPKQRWAVYLDGGSSGTRVHVFQYETPTVPHMYARVHLPSATIATEPGLSAYGSAPEQAGDSLRPLLDFAARLVPAHARRDTPVRLLATAGLRMVEEEIRSVMLESTCAVLSKSGFAFRREWASVISGDMEGLYGWVGANYATGALAKATAKQAHGSRKERAGSDGGNAADYSGVLELGGASFQVTFMPGLLEDSGKRMDLPVQLPGVNAPLFTHSFLGLGLDTAMATAAEYLQRSGVEVDPCLPVGYIAVDGRHGNSSFDGCLQLALSVLPLSGCTAAMNSAASLLSWDSLRRGDSGVHTDEVIAKERAAKDEAREWPGSVESRSASHADVGHVPAQQHPFKKQLGAGRRCMLEGVALPELAGSFLAVENLAWTVQALGLGRTMTLAELADAGRAHCAMHWSSLSAKFSGHVQERFLTRYCFAAAYIYALLRAGLDIGPDEQRIVFSNTLSNSEQAPEIALNWVTGALVVDAMGEAGEVQQRWVSFVLLLLVAAAVARMAFTYWHIAQGGVLWLWRVTSANGTAGGSHVTGGIRKPAVGALPPRPSRLNIQTSRVSPSSVTVTVDN